MTQAAILAASGSPGTTTGFKNKIINGAMVIDQRNAGASVTPTTDQTYTVDRWEALISQASKFSVQQQTSVVPTGFTNAVKITSLASTSLGAGDYFCYAQIIEGYNMADLNWGTANAKTITLSFWVYSSLTGTFGGNISNGSQSRAYPFTYSIPTANTWTTISVTIAGDTSGTWLTTNGRGIWLQMGLGVGTTYSGTAGAWVGSALLGATGATSVVGTNGATFYITGVQLEVGTSATGFEYRQYGTELSLCQRYYAKLGAVNTDANAGIGSGLFNSAGTVARCYFPYPVSMRTKPTVTQSNAGVNDISSGYNVTAINTTWVTTNSMMLDFAISPSGSAYRPVILTLSASNGYVDVTAEL
jgi:hypothetical protein